MLPVGTVFDLLPHLQQTEAADPKTFEELGVPNGLLVYQTPIQTSIVSLTFIICALTLWIVGYI